MAYLKEKIIGRWVFTLVVDYIILLYYLKSQKEPYFAITKNLHQTLIESYNTSNQNTYLINLKTLCICNLHQPLCHLSQNKPILLLIKYYVVISQTQSKIGVPCFFCIFFFGFFFGWGGGRRQNRNCLSATSIVL